MQINVSQGGHQCCLRSICDTQGTISFSLSLLSISNCDDRGIAMDDRNTEQVVNLANEQHRRAFILVRYCKDITE